MTVSLYSQAAPTFLSFLDSLAHILRKAEAYAAAKKIDPEALLKARLAPDMFHLTKQVQVACDFAKTTMCRLAGVEPPSHPDEEQTFADLQARIAKARAVVAGQGAEAVEAGAERIVTLKLPSGDMQMPGAAYYANFALPNFFFHTSMVYAILRHNGVELGKGDFFGRG